MCKRSSLCAIPREATLADREDHGWDAGFEAHTLEQRKRLARLSLAEKLDWLEEAHRLVLALQAKRAAGEPPAAPGSRDD